VKCVFCFQCKITLLHGEVEARRKQDPNVAHLLKLYKDSGKRTRLGNRTTYIDVTTTQTHKDWAKTQGLNTSANKLNKIKRGVANQKHLGRLIDIRGNS